MPSVEMMLDELERIDKPALLAAFEQHYGRPAPRRMRRELLLLAVAYRVQDQASGGKDAALRRRLDRLVITLSKTGSVSAEKPAFKPGTRLIREWNGESHQVTVLEGGYWYRGMRHRSLSAIAKQITGAHWSGPTFFGLNSQAHE